MYEIPRRFSGYEEKNEREKAAFREEFTHITIQEMVKTQTALIQSTAISGGFTSFLEKESDADDIYDSIFRIDRKSIYDWILSEKRNSRR